MSERTPANLISTIAKLADRITSTCDAADEVPTDITVVARVQPVVREMFIMCGRNLGASSPARRRETDVQEILERCERNMRSLHLKVAHAIPPSPNTEAHAGSSVVARSRLLAEQQLMHQLHEDLASLHHELIVQAPEKLSLLLSGAKELEQMAQEQRGKYAHTGEGAQFNNINESHGTFNVTNNSNTNNRGQIYFGQHQTFTTR